MEFQMKAPEKKVTNGQVHCPMCTHSVSGEVEYTKKWMKVVPGQKCERCWHWETDVGSNPEHPTICGRCVKAVQSLTNA